MLPALGTVPTTETVLYRVPTGLHAVIEWITVACTGDSSIMRLYLTAYGRKVQLTPNIVLTAGGFLEEDKVIRLPSGAFISGVAGKEGLEFIISGHESV